MKAKPGNRSRILAGVLLALAGAAGSAHAQSPASAAVATARGESIAPRRQPPAWLEWDKVQRGLRFYESRQEAIDQILATTSLVSTFAAKDVAPVLVQTGRLTNPKDYIVRMQETGQWIGEILQPAASQEQFLEKNYGRAVDLGLLHQGVARAVNARLGWEKQRAVMNQPAFAFVLYTFAWQPVEALLATGRLSEAADGADIGAWLHLWRVVGYAMGASEDLLPVSVSQARATVAQLRAAQYTLPGESAPPGISDMLRGQLAMMMAGMERSGAVPHDKLRETAAGVLTQAIDVSPGLADALHLHKPVTASLLALLSAGGN